VIFIGWELSDPNAHFVTNIVDSIGSGNDLIVDLRQIREWSEIANLIQGHCSRALEQFVIYNAHTNESLPLYFKRDFPFLKLITFFSDDEWRHDNYDRYLALFSDVCTVAVKSNIARYNSCSLQHVHYMRWGCNPALYHPVKGLEQVYDVTFVGAAYGNRVDYVCYLLRAGVKLKVFGPGWGRHSDVREHWGGILSHQDMIRVISQTKISLNFLWPSRGDGTTTIKGRTLELAACRAFQLSNITEEFANYGFVPGENIAIFENKKDLLAKIQHYLAHPELRNDISDASYRLVLSKLTWRTGFDELFKLVRRGEFHSPVLPRFKVLVIVANGVRHNVSSDDPRLEILVVAESIQIWNCSIFHGVVLLDRDSTMNNDVLYMMAFGIYADQAEGALVNFYLGSHWIRFKDQVVRSNRSLADLLPYSCFMAAGGVWARHRPKLGNQQSKIAFVEYPALIIKLPYFQARLLRLFFCDHGDSRERIRVQVMAFKFAKATSIILDKCWQKAFV
jgi:spore maturation protein CgeB